MRVRAEIGECVLVTTDEVLAEFLTGVGGGGPRTRQMAASLVRRALRSSTVVVLLQSRETLLAGLTLYEARPDKTYSLVDCVSMATMRAHGLTDVLTNDQHFGQEGFNVLMQRKDG